MCGQYGRRYCRRVARPIDPSMRGRALDVLPAAVLLAVGIAEVASDGALRPPWEWTAAAVVGAAGLTWRRSSPFVALAAAYGVVVFAGARAPSYDALPTFPLLMGLVALFSVGEWVPPPRSLLGPVLAFPVLGAVALLVDDLAFSDILITPFFGVAVWGAGFLLRRARGQARTISAQAEVFAEERAVLTREAVAEERARIARELHDAVAQSISVTVLQLGAVRHRLREDQEVERETLLGLEESGRDAIVELRRMLGILRERALEPDPGPAPGLARVEQLVASARQRGLPVTVRRVGADQRLPSGLDLSAYRIVQESLNNVLQHAPGATTELTICVSADRLLLRIANDPAPGAHPTEDAWPRHGLIGMRERATIFGGELHAGRRADGGFEVEASLPIRLEVP